MKHLFILEKVNEPYMEVIPENTEVLLTSQPFDDRVRVFVPIGYLNKSEDLAQQIGQYIRSRRRGTITRNDGHYIEVTIEDHEDDGPTKAS